MFLFSAFYIITPSALRLVPFDVYCVQPVRRLTSHYLVQGWRHSFDRMNPLTPHYHVHCWRSIFYQELHLYHLICRIYWHGYHSKRFYSAPLNTWSEVLIGRIISLSMPILQKVSQKRMSKLLPSSTNTLETVASLIWSLIIEGSACGSFFISKF